MILSLVLIAAKGSATQDAPVVDLMLLRSYGFGEVHAIGIEDKPPDGCVFGSGYFLKDTSRHLVMTVGVKVLINAAELMPLRYRFAMRPPKLEESMPSGVPCGQRAYWTGSDSALRLVAEDPFDRVQLDCRDEGIPDSKGFRTPRTIDFTSEMAWLETLARDAFVRAAGKRTTPTVDTLIDKTNVRTRRGTSTETAFYNLKDWAEARQWSLTLSEDKNSFVLTKDAKHILVPRGAMSVRVDEEWRGLPDVSVEAGGELYVPADFDKLAQ